MLFYVVLAFGFLNGALGLTLSCISESHAACEINSALPNAFPLTQEAVDNVCSNLNRIKACLKKYDCGGDISFEDKENTEYEKIKSAESLVNFVSEICRKDSDAYSSVLSASNFCQLLAHKVCKSETLQGGIPETVEEIVKACANFTKINQCIADDLRTCFIRNENLGRDDRHWLDMRQIIMEGLEQICSLNPDTYSKFISSKECALNFSRAEFKESSCRKAEDKLFAAIQKRKERLFKSENATVTSLYDGCLSRLFQTNCLIDRQYRACGSDARDVVFEIFGKADDWDEVCPLDIRIDVLELMDDLSSLTGKYIYVKDYLITDTLF